MSHALPASILSEQIEHSPFLFRKRLKRNEVEKVILRWGLLIKSSLFLDGSTFGFDVSLLIVIDLEIFGFVLVF